MWKNKCCFFSPHCKLVQMFVFPFIWKRIQYVFNAGRSRCALLHWGQRSATELPFTDGCVPFPGPHCLALRALQKKSVNLLQERDIWPKSKITSSSMASWSASSLHFALKEFSLIHHGASYRSPHIIYCGRLKDRSRFKMSDHPPMLCWLFNQWAILPKMK